MIIDNTTIEFIEGFHKYSLTITALNPECTDYSMHLFLNRQQIDDNFDEVFSTWIDNSGGEVEGNQEVYKIGFDKAIEKSYEIFNKLMEIE